MEKNMGFVHGLRYNLRGLQMGLASGRLLFWGLIRFILIVVITIAVAGIILNYRVQLTELLWAKPESVWVAWLWHILSWTVSLVLVSASAILSFLCSQILFSAVIMDHMSRITEFQATGSVDEGQKKRILAYLLHMIKQEIPRTIVPLIVFFVLALLGWISPFGPLPALISAVLSIIFLSWDNTDLVPARRLIPFRKRYRFLMASLPFHIGFGLPFLIPGLNLLFLAFAPVGATLYYVERIAPGRKTKLNALSRVSQGMP